MIDYVVHIALSSCRTLSSFYHPRPDSLIDSIRFWIERFRILRPRSKPASLSFQPSINLRYPVVTAFIMHSSEYQQATSKKFSNAVVVSFRTLIRPVNIQVKFPSVLRTSTHFVTNSASVLSMGMSSGPTKCRQNCQVVAASR